MIYKTKFLEEEMADAISSNDIAALDRQMHRNSQFLYDTVMRQHFPALYADMTHHDLSCDLSDSRLLFVHSFSMISNFARRNCIFLQLLNEAVGGKKYFTTRKNMASFLILQTLEGGGKLTYQNKTYRLTPGRVFIIDCRLLHDYRTEGDFWKMRSVHFDGVSVPGLFRHILSTGSCCFYFDPDSHFDALMNQLFDINMHTSRDIELMNNSLMIQIVTELLLKSSDEYKENSIPPDILRIKDFLSENCCSEITLEALSRHFGFSQSYLCHEFKKNMNCTIGEYIVQERLSIAKDKLIYTNDTLTEIAASVGYPNPSNFGKMFLKHCGISPNKYRKAIRAKQEDYIHARYEESFS
ncbi:MAG: AraC family transcriptional regulator [Eubacteriales bacterium]|nr:AraC family transcriptional regulator [Eubacteriales bacterium]